MNIVHFSFNADGGAGRAGRRSSLACQLAGLNSTFVCVAGTTADASEIRLDLEKSKGDAPIGRLGVALEIDIQWNFLLKQRTPLSNTLFSIPYPGADLVDHRLFSAADVIHLHWPTWASRRGPSPTGSPPARRCSGRCTIAGR